MKLNNRGWGLQAMLAAVLVLMIALVVIAVLVEKTFGDIMNSINVENHPNNNPTEDIDKENNDDQYHYKSYSEIENAVVTASKKYQKKYYDDILDGEKISVTIKNMQEEKFISEIKDIKDSKIKCSGYAIIINNDNSLTYTAYIKCGNNYETTGYQDFYDMY